MLMLLLQHKNRIPSSRQPSTQRQAPVDGKNLASNEVWGRGEEADGGSDILTASVFPHGSEPGHLAHEGLGGFFAEVDHSGSYGVDGDLRATV